MIDFFFNIINNINSIFYYSSLVYVLKLLSVTWSWCQHDYQFVIYGYFSSAVITLFDCFIAETLGWNSKYDPFFEFVLPDRELPECTYKNFNKCLLKIQKVIDIFVSGVNLDSYISKDAKFLFEYITAYLVLFVKIFMLISAAVVIAMYQFPKDWTYMCHVLMEFYEKASVEIKNFFKKFFK
jgi:hypothetical protein